MIPPSTDTEVFTREASFVVSPPANRTCVVFGSDLIGRSRRAGGPYLVDAARRIVAQVPPVRGVEHGRAAVSINGDCGRRQRQRDPAIRARNPKKLAQQACWQVSESLAGIFSASC